MATERDVAPDQEVLLAQELFRDPRTRPLIEQAIATAHPETAHASVPAYMLRKEVSEATAALQKERDEWKAERQKEADDRKAATELGQWRRSLVQHGARPEEIKDVEEFARKRNNANPEDVMEAWRKQQRLAEPTSGRFGVRMPGASAGEFFKGLDENPDKFARERFAKDLADMTAGRPLDPSPIG